MRPACQQTSRWTAILLVGVVLFVIGREAKAGLPTVTGEAADQLQEADLQAIQTLASALHPPSSGTPILIKTVASSAQAAKRKIWTATAYFPPDEITGEGWRGRYLTCYKDYDPSCWNPATPHLTAGAWMTFQVEGMGEYLVVPTKNGFLPNYPPRDFTTLAYIKISSPLPTNLLASFVDTVQGFTKIRPDHPELSFADLSMDRLRTSTTAEGIVCASMFVDPPKGSGESRVPYQVRARLVGKRGWKIINIIQEVY